MVNNQINKENMEVEKWQPENQIPSIRPDMLPNEYLYKWDKFSILGWNVREVLT